MASENFHRPGAVDLGTVSSQTSNQPAGRFVVECDEKNFNQLASDSIKYPIVMEFYSSANPAPAVSEELVKQSDLASGQFMLARVDINQAPKIAQALGIQAVPTVIAIIGGRVAPLFQGTKDAAEIDEVISVVKQTAIANGITGRAAPVATVADGAEDGSAQNPKFAKAESLLDLKDYQGALDEYQRILTEAPNDAEAIAGKAMAGLLVRSTKFDPVEAMTKAPDLDNVPNQMNLADLEMIQGNIEAALNRLIQLISRTGDDEIREELRLRVLELFEVAGKTDPVVLKARRKLSTALFTH